MEVSKKSSSRRVPAPKLQKTKTVKVLSFVRKRNIEIATEPAVDEKANNGINPTAYQQ